MIIQPTIIISKQQNQPHRECLYAWYPEATNDIVTQPRDIYIHNGIDKDLLEQKSSTSELTSDCNNSSSGGELLQRYKQSIAPSDRAYHSTETIDEALNPPWALHYEIKRQPATPNLSSKSTDMSIREEPPRRLKSAPIVHSLPPPAPVLYIPEPRFITTVIPAPTPPPPSQRPKTRASSAKARLNTTVPNANRQEPQYRLIKSAQVSRPKSDKKLTEEEIEQIFKRVYGENIEQPQEVQPIQIIHVQAQPSPPAPAPVYMYQKSASWCADEVSSTPVTRSIEVKAVPLNPYYIHRPGVISIRNTEKKSVVRENSALRKPSKHHRRYYHSHGRRDEPLLALKSIPQKSRLSLEIDGVQLIHDPRLTLEDKSINLTKYFIDGKLYLIKDKRYNVLDNIDPSLLEKYNQNLTRPQRSRHYQTPPELHSNHVHRYVIDRNLISQDLNVNKMSLSKRPQTATVYT